MCEKQTILLVDDNENDVFLTRVAFKRAGVSSLLREVHNGEEAIAYLLGENAYSNREEFPLPTLMLLDIKMPQKNGFDVLTWVRSQPGIKRLFIVVLTASTREDDIEMAFDLGANSFLVKPSTLTELTNMIQCLDAWRELNQFPSLIAKARN